MNDLLFYALMVVLLYYFFIYLPKKKLAAKTTASASTQTDLKDKQIINLIQQWEQVAHWAKEEGIDVNKKWNLGMLKSKLASNKPGPQLEKSLDDLIKQMQDLNKQL